MRDILLPDLNLIRSMKLKFSKTFHNSSFLNLYKIIAICMPLLFYVSLKQVMADISFAGVVSPPRFELQGKPGDVIRNVVLIGNDALKPAHYHIRTADWDLDEQYGVVIHPPELQPDSCRPWTRIERRELKLAPQQNRKFRFEIKIPEDAKTGECRLAILVEQTTESAVTLSVGNDIQIPLTGRLGVIIYVKVGDAQPKLEFQEIGLSDVNGRMLPVAMIRNTGNAHGRPVGIIEGTDNNKQFLEFIVSPLAILPGETRAIPLTPASPEDPQKTAEFTLPLKLKGPIEWEHGKFDLDVILQ